MGDKLLRCLKEDKLVFFVVVVSTEMLMRVIGGKISKINSYAGVSDEVFLQ